MVDFKTRDRTNMYVTTHDTAKFSLLTYLMTNNTVSSTSGEYGLVGSVV